MDHYHKILAEEVYGENSCSYDKKGFTGPACAVKRSSTHKLVNSTANLQLLYLVALCVFMNAVNMGYCENIDS